MSETIYPHTQTHTNTSTTSWPDSRYLQ